MKEKLLAELKKKYAGQLTAKFIEQLADRLLLERVAKEEDIEAAISELDKSPIQPIDLQAEGDRRSAEWKAKITDLENRLTAGQVNYTPPEPKKPEPNNFNADEAFAKLMQRIDAIENRVVGKDLKERLTATLKGKEIPLSLADGINLKDESELEGALSAIEQKYNALKSEMVAGGIIAEPPKKPTGGAPTSKDTVKAELEALKNKF